MAAAGAAPLFRRAPSVPRSVHTRSIHPTRNCSIQGSIPLARAARKAAAQAGNVPASMAARMSAIMPR